ncbi:MAG: methylated-DNA--[protein]-cysteine S-methyltransferase [Gracilibacteraceae bacterium]|jgi:methylated-DNA-[protein]-cysteine S-methyltransferase|nr:methylated-DNA--[protein]-cysteine S-methyltransferase [Gracilibacteraceae bacterium]
MYYSTTFESPVGLLTMASDGQNLVGLWLGGQKYHGGTLPEKATERDDIPVFAATKTWLSSYFAGEKPEVSALPLAPIGSEFRQGVWMILRSIPYGSVLTYGEIAKMMAVRANKERMSAQAVGGAVGHNPISIIIPCHRVVGANGNLTGYGGGIAKKVKLLELEGVDLSRFFVPAKGTAL